jgi:hypothetical protein
VSGLRCSAEKAGRAAIRQDPTLRLRPLQFSEGVDAIKSLTMKAFVSPEAQKRFFVLSTLGQCCGRAGAIKRPSASGRASPDAAFDNKFTISNSVPIVPQIGTLRPKQHRVPSELCTRRIA